MTSGKDIETDVSIAETGKGIQQIIRKAWEGEEAFSGVFYDEELKTEVIGYAVPVYREGQIIGALAATEEADALKNS